MESKLLKGRIIRRHCDISIIISEKAILKGIETPDFFDMKYKQAIFASDKFRHVKSIKHNEELTKNSSKE